MFSPKWFTHPAGRLSEDSSSESEGCPCSDITYWTETQRRNEPNVTNYILTSVSSFSIIVTFFLAENDSNPES